MLYVNWSVFLQNTFKCVHRFDGGLSQNGVVQCSHKVPQFHKVSELAEIVNPRVVALIMYCDFSVIHFYIFLHLYTQSNLYQFYQCRVICTHCP